MQRRVQTNHGFFAAEAGVGVAGTAGATDAGVEVGSGAGTGTTGVTAFGSAGSFIAGTAAGLLSGAFGASDLAAPPALVGSGAFAGVAGADFVPTAGGVTVGAAGIAGAAGAGGGSSKTLLDCPAVCFRVVSTASESVRTKRITAR